jgi:hypothetical protein
MHENSGGHPFAERALAQTENLQFRQGQHGGPGEGWRLRRR